MIGKSLLHYEIKDRLGKGGMGEVFSARDTKLGRDVAIKVLPPDMAGDPEREARFQREARSLASLQHPNVASIYGFEEADGFRFLVMELVVGSDLTRRMAAGPVSVPETLVIARQIAAGLEAAHENGIVHRDLKPANIMETESGEVKILDFGLAQAWLGDGSRQNESSAMPTITAAMTMAGTVLGTAAYMSPEQARGGSVDRRTDIWAFGVIMFEMLTGKRLFEGETASDTLAAVLRAEPEWNLLPVAEAPALCRLVERCLERNPKQRLRDIGEARIFLQDSSGSSSHLSFSHLAPPNVAADAVRGRAPALLLVGVTAACLLLGTFVGWKVVARPAPAPLLHTMIPPPPKTNYNLNSTAPGPAALSPDGTMMAFCAVDDDNKTMLYLRYLDKGESTVMSGTNDASYPFWSPDGRYIGFFDNRGKKLKKVAVAGGPPVTLCVAENMKGGSWNEQGDIIFAPSFDSGIFRVPASGGDPVRLTKRGPEHNSHRHPRFLPGGREFLFIGRLTSGESEGTVFIASLDTTVTPRAVATSQGQAEYVDGMLMTVREGVLMSVPFKPDQEKADAGGTPLVEDVLYLSAAVVGVFSFSQTGMIVYQTGASDEAARVLAWVDLASGASVPLGEMGQVYHPAVAPDGRRAIIEVRNASNEGTDLWLVDLATGLRTRFTFATGDEVRACWSRDSATVYYESREAGTYRIMQQPVEGQGGEAIVLESTREISPTDASLDGSTLLFDSENEEGRIEMHRLRLDAGSATPVTVAAAGEKDLGGGKYSPDGRWIVYHTQTSAGWDVFVMPAAGGARKWQVTSEGAVYPHWNKSGTELWVSKFNGDLYVYDVDGSSETFRVGNARRTVTVYPPDGNGCFYDLHPDGKRILQTGADPEFRAEVSFLHLVTDWRRGLVQ
jgi:serine/threonine protein kinase